MKPTHIFLFHTPHPAKEQALTRLLLCHFVTSIKLIHRNKIIAPRKLTATNFMQVYSKTHNVGQRLASAAVKNMTVTDFIITANCILFHVKHYKLVFVLAVNVIYISRRADGIRPYIVNGYVQSPLVIIIPNS